MKIILLISLLVSTSCQKSFIFLKSTELETMSCLQVENCSSSLNKELSDYIPPFKMIGDSVQENLDNIEKVSKKYGLNIIERKSQYLLLADNLINFEFFADEENNYIIVKAQINSTNWRGNKSFNPIELIRFDFFQKNY